MRPVRRTATPSNYCAPQPHGEPLEELAQRLVPAGTEVLVRRSTEQRRQLRFGQREAGILKQLVHVRVFEFKGHAQLLEHQVVGDLRFHGPLLGWITRAAAVDHQPVQEMRQHQVRAGDKTGLAFFGQVGLEVRLLQLEAGVGQPRPPANMRQQRRQSQEGGQAGLEEGAAVVVR